MTTKSIKDIKCKKCGGTNFVVSEFYQNIREYKVLANGKLSKKCHLYRDMPMENSVLQCADCGCVIDYWGEDEDGFIEVIE